MGPFVSIVVATLGRRPDTLERCLASLQAQSYPEREVLIVLNGPENPSVTALAEKYQARVVLEPRRGQCFGRNQGIRAARGEIIVFTDDDVAVVPEWVDKLVEGFADARVWCVTGAVALEGHGYIPDEWCSSERMRSAWILDRTQEDWFLQGLLIDTGFGCNMSYRREVFERCGLFPTDLGAGSLIGCGDEHYMFLQVLKAGGAISHRPGAVVRLSFPEPAEEQRQRIKHLHAGAVAFFLKLLFLEGGYRWQLLRRLGRAFLKLARGAPGYAPAGGIRLSRWEKVVAFSRGIGVYVRSERKRRAQAG